MTEETLKTYVEAKIYPDANGGCWLWSGSLDEHGYGVAYDPIEKKKIGAHRLSFRAYRGTLTEGLVIDHKCRVRSCVNPDHLRQVTNAENVLCGEGLTAQNAKKTHCPSGHPYEGDYLFEARGWRGCRICRAEANMKYKARKKAERHERGLLRKPHTNHPRRSKIAHLLPTPAAQPSTPTDVTPA